MRRQRLQDVLRNRRGTLAAQVMENMRRRFGRGSSQIPCPLQYLERFGGYGQNTELAVVAWLTAGILEAAWARDIEATQDLAALMLVAVEQANLDQGNWDLAWLLTLQDDIPSGVFAPSRNLGPGPRAFAPLASQQWTTIALAYLREMDTLQTRRRELREARRPPRFQQRAPGSDQSPPQGADGGDAPGPTPKRRPRRRGGAPPANA